MKTKVRIRKRNLKTTTGLKSFKRKKAMSNLMRKIRWNNRKKMNNRKR
jgi:hypothetical protein